MAIGIGGRWLGSCDWGKEVAGAPGGSFVAGSVAFVYFVFVLLGGFEGLEEGFELLLMIVRHAPR
jgi:hypothetical protein